MNIFSSPIAALCGVVLPVMLYTGGRLGGFTRERSSFSFIVMVTASYYVLFAILVGSFTAIWQEAVIMFIFFAIAVAGFKGSQWLLVAALVMHGIFDTFHGQVIHNGGMPDWWPVFCLVFDVVMAVAVAMHLRSSVMQQGRGNSQK